MNAGIDHAFHALSLDESRGPFHPTLMYLPKLDPTASGQGIHLRQTWFPGVHSSVGGGYPTTHISAIPLIWMIDQFLHPSCHSTHTSSPCQPLLAFNLEFLTRLIERNHHPERSLRRRLAKDADREYPPLGFATGSIPDSWKETWALSLLTGWHRRKPGNYCGESGHPGEHGKCIQQDMSWFAVTGNAIKRRLGLLKVDLENQCGDCVHPGSGNGEGATNEKIHFSVRTRWEKMGRGYRPVALTGSKGSLARRPAYELVGDEEGGYRWVGYCHHTGKRVELPEEDGLGEWMLKLKDRVADTGGPEPDMTEVERDVRRHEYLKDGFDVNVDTVGEA